MPKVRELTAHRVNGLNEALRIFVLDEPGHGGACHKYVVLIPREDAWSCDWRNSDMYDIAEGQWLHIYEGSKARIQVDVIADPNGGLLRESKYYGVQGVYFQNGPVKEHGYNGSSHEALLAILSDRLEGFQAGPFAGRDNALALTKLDEARLWLHKRTMDRVSRGVEGTSKP